MVLHYFNRIDSETYLRSGLQLETPTAALVWLVGFKFLN